MRWSIVLILMFYSMSFFGQALAADHLSYYQTAPDDSLTTGKLLELSNKYTFSEPEKAKAYAERAVSVAFETGNKSDEIKGLYQLGSIDIRQGNSNAARPHFEAGLEKSRELDNRQLTADGLYHLSRLYEGENKFSEAINFLQKSLELYKGLGLEANIARCYSSFGRIYQQTGNYAEALNNYFPALRINEEIGRKRGISIVKTNIGNVYLNTGKFDDAIKYFTEALLVDQANNDREGVLINTLNIGVAKQKKGFYDEALEHFRKALPIAEELNYKEDVAVLLGNIGSTLRQQGNLEQGLDYLFSSLAIRNENNYDNAHTLNDISVTYFELGNYVQAESFAQQAVQSSKNGSDLNQLKEGYLNVSNALQRQGDFENAYSALVLHDNAKDSLFSLEKQRQMEELEVMYETEKKEQEIELLTLEKKTAEFRRNTYLVSGLLITFILLLLYVGQRYKSKKNHQLLEKEQEVAEMKSNFFSNISHEFRTPLTLISGPIEMLKEGIENSKMRSQLDIMEKNADRLLSLINQLLDLSRLESGKLELFREKTNIVGMVKGVTMTFQSLAEIKKIGLTIETEIAFLEFNVDREKVETILINLINNAFTYTPKGGKVTVSLEIEEDQHGDNVCQIRVKDTGKGIPEQELPYVFNRFYRGSDSEMEQTEGTGIGLALTKELVELHGGSIEVSSKESQWTEFVVTLPIENADYSEESRSVIKITDAALSVEIGTDEAVKSEEPDELRLSEDSAPILLLIEDNEDVMHYLKDILRDSYQILEASDGEEGVEAAFEHIPDLIISDVMMPKMDGYQVAETLKQDQKTSHIPLILLTAKADQKDKIQGLKAHADEYLTKPFLPEELKVRIQNLIESRRQMREKYKREFMMRPDEISVHSMDDAFLLRVKKVVDEHIDDEHFTVEQLGREVSMSRSQIHRKLVALTAQSATEFIRSYRLHRAKDMIGKDAGSISEIAYAVGFGSPSYFSKCFRKEFDISPSEARDNHP